MAEKFMLQASIIVLYNSFEFKIELDNAQCIGTIIEMNLDRAQAELRLSTSS